MEQIIKSGQGWRIGWNPQTHKFKGLVGGENWAIELTEPELTDFCRLLTQLSQTMHQISNELMNEEKITCEAESDLLWMEVEGYPFAYSLRLILNTGRRAEGHWESSAIPELIQAVQILNVF